MTLTPLKISGQLFCRILVSLVYLMFSHDYDVVCISDKNSTGMVCPFHGIMSEPIISICLITSNINLVQLIKVVSAGYFSL